MKVNFTILKLKNILKLFAFTIILISLFAFSKYNVESIKNTISLFIYCVFPSLFPFLFFTEFISNTDILNYISKKSWKLIYKIFPVSKYATSCILIGFLCGFPSGAKIVIKLYNEGKLSYNQSKILLSFTNNFNPIFIITTVGICMFGNFFIGILLLISHYLASLAIGYINCKINYKLIIHEKDNFLNTIRQKNILNDEKIDLFTNVKKSISNTFLILVNVLGFMLLFNLISDDVEIILRKFNINNNIINLITSFFEATKGISNIISSSNFSNEFKFVFISILLGFSGLCIIFQIYSVIYEDDYSITYLIIYKIMHGMLSGFISFILLKILNIANIKIFIDASVFSNIDTFTHIKTKIPQISIYYLILALVTIFYFCVIIHKKKIVKKKI